VGGGGTLKVNSRHKRWNFRRQKYLLVAFVVGLRSSQVSTSTLTSSRKRYIGTLFSLVHWIRTVTLLQVALLSRSQLGSSSSSVRTSSLSSRLVSSPSPFSVDRWICSQCLIGLFVFVIDASTIKKCLSFTSVLHYLRMGIKPNKVEHLTVAYS
jgi:hypothetical protein